MNEIIIKNPELYLHTQNISLEQRLKKIELSQEEKQSIIASNTNKIVRDKILGFFKVGDLVNTLINWNEEVDKETKEAKKEYLLTLYFDKQDKMEERLNNLKKLITNPIGNTLFNKIIRILDNSTPDLELTNHLAKALKNIVKSDFNSLFEDHKYALNQIEMLTPQALTLLSDYENWPTFSMKSFAASTEKITSDWLPEFVDRYSTTKNITEKRMKAKISHSMNDLIKNRHVEALHKIDGLTKSYIKIDLTEIGRIIMKYIM